MKTHLDDFSASVAACEAAQAAGTEISDGAARTIAALYAEGMGDGQRFATTGTVTDNTWRSLFGGGFYSQMPPNEQLLADMLGTYLTGVGERGPVAGWSNLWVR